MFQKILCLLFRFSYGVMAQSLRFDNAEGEVHMINRSTHFVISASVFLLSVHSVLASPIQTESSEDTILVEWVREITTTPSSSMDAPADVAVDAQGNVYVTGKSEGQASTYDYLTVKYNSLGVVQWSARYDGPLHGFDIPNAIAIDQAGNVYVTGMSVGSDSTYNDFATIKYGANGALQWVAQHNGPGNQTDVAKDVAVDEMGNVYVTGFQTGLSTHDFATIKYNPQGFEEWTATYDGPAHVNDEATAIALDVVGNIFVAGWSTDSVGSDTWGTLEFHDYTVMKYNPSGEILWVATYNVGDTWYATPAAMGITNDGSIYVTGRATSLSDDQWQYSPYVSNLATVKLSPNGALMWASLFPNTPPENPGANDIYIAEGIAFDTDGNVYVAAMVGSQDPYFHVGDSLLTIKYSPNGDRLWVAYHDDQASPRLSSGGIAVAGNGNVYVTGSHGHETDFLVGDSIATICYNSNGILQWTRYYEGATGSFNLSKGITADESGNVYVIGSSGPEDEADFISLKYSPSGSETWVSPTTGPGNSIEFVSVAAIDRQGNVYVAGTSYGPEMNQNYLTLKINADGNIAWSASYDGPASRADYPTAITIDDSGNVYVTGSSGSSSSDEDFATIKYGPSGDQLWEARFNSTSLFEDVPTALAVDGLGNVYVGGWPGLLKYNAWGIQQWDAPTYSNSAVTSIVPDDSGNVYIIAAGLMKYNSDGIRQWIGSGWGQMLAIDDSGYIYTTQSDSTTKKFTPSGNQLWSVSEGGREIYILDNSYLYVGGSWQGSLHKLTTTGVHLWTQYQGTSWFRFRDLAVDGFGNAYMSGSDWNPFHLELATTKFTSSGEEKWSVRYGGGSQSEYRGIDVLSDSLGNIYVIGERSEPTFTTTPVIIKYSRSGPVSSAQSNEGEVPNEYGLAQNYPNPFNPETTIRFQIPTAGLVDLRVYDILGREVSMLVNQHLDAGMHSVRFNAEQLASGMYFYRLNVGGYVATKKLTVLR